MKRFRLMAAFALAAAALPMARAQDFLDRLGETLTFTGFNDNFRARVSGTLDLEYYQFQQPAPGLILTEDDSLFNARLSLFIDAQLGPKFYLFIQSRIDSGFDPTDRGVQLRLDEYALRYTPWEDGRLNIQIGTFGSVVGNWIPRHLSWENPFVTAPVPYEVITKIEDKTAPFPGYLTLPGGIVDEKEEYLPSVIWGPSYASGLSVAGRLGQFDYAAEIKNAALASRPESWHVNAIGFEHPTISTRLGFRPNPMWTFGVSASDGAYFRPEAQPTLPMGRDIGDYHQRVLAQDIGFAWHHLQLWAEFFEARYEVPGIGDADLFAYYFEAKYKFTPQFFGAVRWNQQFFADVPDLRLGGMAPWGHDRWRTDVVVGYRFTPHTQLKIQYNIEHEKNGPRDLSHTFATQFTVRF
jgi:hypothetical protein